MVRAILVQEGLGDCVYTVAIPRVTARSASGVETIEWIEVVEEVWPGGDPMAVRLGSTTFALRRHEASAVIVEPAPVKLR